MYTLKYAGNVIGGFGGGGGGGGGAGVMAPPSRGFGTSPTPMSNFYCSVAI